MRPRIHWHTRKPVRESMYMYVCMYVCMRNTHAEGITSLACTSICIYKHMIRPMPTWQNCV